MSMHVFALKNKASSSIYVVAESPEKAKEFAVYRGHARKVCNLTVRHMSLDAWGARGEDTLRQLLTYAFAGRLVKMITSSTPRWVIVDEEGVALQGKEF